MTNNYYQKNKKKLRKEACERYQNLSEKEKDKKCQYASSLCTSNQWCVGTCACYYTDQMEKIE